MSEQTKTIPSPQSGCQQSDTRKIAVTVDQNGGCALWPETAIPCLRYDHDLMEWTTDGRAFGAVIGKDLRRILIGRRHGNFEIVQLSMEED